VGRLCTRGKYLRIKKDAHELPYNTSTLLPGKSKNPKKGLVNPSSSTGIVKEADRGEKEFKAPDEKSEGKSGIFLGPDSSIISSISSFKIF
jgi:hypothetical protein